MNTMTAVSPSTFVYVNHIIGTSLVVLSAWEPFRNHTTSFHVDGVAYGKIGSRPLPAALESLPYMSLKRYDAVTAHQEALYAEAYAAIEASGLAGGMPEVSRFMGDVTCEALIVA